MSEPTESSKESSFPYPLWPSKKPGRDQTLVEWIRNHSSYLTVGSMASKLGSVATIVYGTLENWVILAPWLLGVAYFVGLFHFYILDHPIRSLVGFTLAIVLGVAVGIGYLQMRAAEKEKCSQSPEPWNATPRPVRILGMLILATTAAVALVAIPFAVEALRSFKGDRSLESWDVAAMAGSVLAVAGTLQGFLSRRYRWAIFALKILAGAIGLGILIGGLLVLESFMVHGNVFRMLRFPLFWTLPGTSISLLTPWVCFLVIGLAAWATIQRTSKKGWEFRRPNRRGLSASRLRHGVLMLLAFLVLWPTAYWMLRRDDPTRWHDVESHLARARLNVTDITQPISAIASADVSEKLPEDTEQILKPLRDQQTKLAEFYNLRPDDLIVENPSQANRDSWTVKYFAGARRLVDLAGGKLGDLDDIELARLRSAVSETNRLELQEFLDSQHKLGEEGIGDLLTEAVVLESLRQQLGPSLRESAKSAEAAGQDVRDDLPQMEKAQKFVSGLRLRRLSKRHQHEFADLVGRNDEQLKLIPRAIKTIANPGDISILPPAETSDDEVSKAKLTKLESSVLSEMRLLYLAALSDYTLDVLSNPVDREQAFEPSLVSKAKLIRSVRRLPVQRLEEMSSLLVSLAIDQTLSSERLKKLRPTDLDAGVVRQLTIGMTGSSTDESIVRQHKTMQLGRYAASELLRRALNESGQIRSDALVALGRIARPKTLQDTSDLLKVYQLQPAQTLPKELVAQGIMARFAMPLNDSSAIVRADDAVLALRTGDIGVNTIRGVRPAFAARFLWFKTHLFLVAMVLLVIAGYHLDINNNSLHGYYRNRLVRAFFVSYPKRDDGREKVFPVADPDFKLSQLSPAGSDAPYLIVNTALNLQAAGDLGLRGRNSDFFFFTKRYCGSRRTGFAETVSYEKAHDEMTLSTAMAISGAAVSPNGGRRTNGLLVMVMTLLNFRLGYWVRNPSRYLDHVEDKKTVSIEKVLGDEQWEVKRRWARVYSEAENESRRSSSASDSNLSLYGIALSGGGIRSASFSLGVLQKLDDLGVFRHFDYLSVVSGGGYLGCGYAVTTANQSNTAPSELDKFQEPEPLTTTDSVKPLRHHLSAAYFTCELTSLLSDNREWVNLSDGGHIENLGGFELLRRRCRFIVLVDGEADPKHQFDGLAALIRLAEIEEGIQIEIKTDKLKLDEHGYGESHFSLGTIRYPENDISDGTLLYLKASMTGDEAVPVAEYKAKNNDFPHQTTGDQFFDPDQFDAYRSLGIHAAEETFNALKSSSQRNVASLASVKEMEGMLDALQADHDPASDIPS